ncbi:hypothetical protein [Bosea sp. (in: a-proteobacteria)]|uniref:hypothetical protein n=1 Tax=Bosea sp. (in: a-proteobacteria) TaxID=1871050 RepID=UPI002FCA72F9
MTKSASKAVESLRKEQRKQKQEGNGSPEKQLDKALCDSFPASDPASQVTPTKPGAPKQRRA